MRNKGKIIAILLISIMVAAMVISCDDSGLNLNAAEEEKLAAELMFSVPYWMFVIADEGDLGEDFDFNFSSTFELQDVGEDMNEVSRGTYIKNGTKITLTGVSDSENLTITIVATNLKIISTKVTLQVEVKLLEDGSFGELTKIVMNEKVLDFSDWDIDFDFDEDDQ